MISNCGLDFGGDLDHDADIGNFKGIYTIIYIGSAELFLRRVIWPWQMFAVS